MFFQLGRTLLKSRIYFKSIDYRLLNTFDTHLEINRKTETLKFPYFWLRDHCRCSECYNKKTEQINFNIIDIPLDIKPQSVLETDGKIKIEWSSDNHKSEYSLNWLRTINLNLTPSKSNKEVVFWNKEDVMKFQDIKVPFKKFWASEQGEKALLKSIVKYGFGFVTGVEPSLEATEAVVKKIGLVQKTLFGEMWEVTNDDAHSDTAYSQIGLLPHTDNTYFNEPAGLQIFHMLSHKGTGGETLLVDGFNGCNALRKKNKEAFDLLCTHPVPAKYLEDGYKYITTETVIKLNPLTEELFHLSQRLVSGLLSDQADSRFNIFDRDVLTTIPCEKIMDFYKAYRLLGNELFNEAAVWRLKLQPGDVIFIDNWRTLHGRASYTGLRRLCGCYIGRADWTSRAQVLGLDII